MIEVYTIGLGVILLAFVLSLFFKVPPLRKTSALQQQADEAVAPEAVTTDAVSTATGNIRVVPQT